MMEFFVLLWTLEIGALVATGPAGVAWLRARREARDFASARIA